MLRIVKQLDVKEKMEKISYIQNWYATGKSIGSLEARTYCSTCLSRISKYFPVNNRAAEKKMKLKCILHLHCLFCGSDCHKMFMTFGDAAKNLSKRIVLTYFHRRNKVAGWESLKNVKK